MSVGGHAIPWLEGVIAHAVSVRNIIVCAAAGNATPFVVYPAAYPDCIAVASSTPTDRPAASSSYGPEVTISALLLMESQLSKPGAGHPLPHPMSREQQHFGFIGTVEKTFLISTKAKLLFKRCLN
jgi:hypothetical protein